MFSRNLSAGANTGRYYSERVTTFSISFFTFNLNVDTQEFIGNGSIGGVDGHFTLDDIGFEFEEFGERLIDVIGVNDFSQRVVMAPGKIPGDGGAGIWLVGSCQEAFQ